MFRFTFPVKRWGLSLIPIVWDGALNGMFPSIICSKNSSSILSSGVLNILLYEFFTVNFLCSLVYFFNLLRLMSKSSFFFRFSFLRQIRSFQLEISSLMSISKQLFLSVFFYDFSVLFLNRFLVLVRVFYDLQLSLFPQFPTIF